MTPGQLREVFAEFEAYLVGREAARWQSEIDARLGRLGAQLGGAAAQAAVAMPEADRVWFLSRVRDITEQAQAGG